MSSEATSPLAWLSRQGAQRDVLDGLSPIGESWERIWRECKRGDWLLGIACRLGVAHASLVLAAVGAARTCPEEWRHPPADALLDLAERWANGEVDADAIARATKALEAAIGSVGHPVVEASMRAAYAVGEGVSDPGVLPMAAAAANEATILNVMECGMDLALGWAQAKCADAVRAHVSLGAFVAAAEAITRGA